MPKSKAFIGIKQDLLKIVQAIPAGQLTTFQSIGEFMNVPPRHIAYILTTLTDEEKLTLPWYRVVGKDGKLSKPRYHPLGASQESLLKEEGIASKDGTVVQFKTCFVAAEAFPHGVTPPARYDA